MYSTASLCRAYSKLSPLSQSKHSIPRPVFRLSSNKTLFHLVLLCPMIVTTKFTSTLKSESPPLKDLHCDPTVASFCVGFCAGNVL